MLRRSVIAITLTLSATGHAASSEGPPATEHGPASSAFPSHRFQLAPHRYPRGEIGVNFGLIQPIFAHGFNIAGEFRYQRLWLEYSHGQSLDYSACASMCLTSDERNAGLSVKSPYTTGFGVGFILIDDVWLGLEFKTHRYEVGAPSGDQVRYQTYSIGPVLGWRFFVVRGLYIDLYARYWPNIANTLPNGEWAVAASGDRPASTHQAHNLGVFANASIGWAFAL
ncbi:hypothetical protein LZC95_22330 [Pendulispora brunnea]|uniref:Outer membrane protein beta-barrel domain-containing protein n=1 Tax=Pendulispora brunnea TaxID=2905690 RepID=A0ABZ2KLJ8_9BACT